MRQAIALATSPDAPRGANPRVGCVVIDAGGSVVGTGYHLGAGTAHAEVVALAQAGERARGGTAVVTLEPCRHTGRTGPCTLALLAAGIHRVVIGMADPTARAGGGAGDLRAAGVEVIEEVLVEECTAVNSDWAHVQRHDRPYVTVKTAMSLDGRVADAGGGPTAITAGAARAWVHDLRTRVDAILVGTNTVRVDDPQLTARAPDGSALPRQPLRVVMGHSEVRPNARLRGEPGEWLHVRTREPRAALEILRARDVAHVLIEGGPQIIRAFLAADRVDQVCWFVSPILLGGGPMALGPLAVPLEASTMRLEVIGDDVLMITSGLVPQSSAGST